MSDEQRTARPRGIDDLAEFALEVVNGRTHTKREAADFFKDFLTVVEAARQQVIDQVLAAPVQTASVSSPVTVLREGKNSIFLGAEANRYYTLDQARALAVEILRVVG